MNSRSGPYPAWSSQPSWLDVGEPGDDDPPKARAPGDPGLSALAGSGAGLLGGVLALALADALAERARLLEHVHVAFGYGSSLVAETPQTVWLRVGLAALAGMLAGAVLGWLTRRLHAIAARVLFGAVLAPSLWIAFDAFALTRFAPRLAGLVPFVPCLLGAAAYGVCVALARPVLRGASRWKAKLADPGGTASFLLVRRR